MVTFEKLKKCFIIAEVSANHGQNFNRAVSMIKTAKKCGADAVKFQTYTPDTLTIDVDNKYFRIKHPKWGGQTLHQLYKKAYTPWLWFKKLKKVADDIDIVFFSTAYDKTSVDFLQDLNVSLHKAASFEFTDLPLIEYMAKTKKPIILSTGIATLDEIGETVQTAKNAGAKNIALLRCVSSYPADPKEMNLRLIPDMQKKFKVTVGLSDHTMGTVAAVVAVSLGACIVEKHFTLSRKIKTADSFFSLEPQELKELINNIRLAEQSLGKADYTLTNGQKMGRVLSRSLFVVKDIQKDEEFSEENIKSIRPAHGLPPKYLKKILGKKAKKNIKKGTPLTFRHVSQLTK